jgi:mannose-6-phosphate isomerase-like protein (cupin superfamily)
MKIVETDKIPYELVTKSNRPGRVHRKFVREGEISPGVGFTADLVYYEGGHGTFNAPRHRHAFDQIRFVVSGRPDFGHHQVAKDGQSIFFPAGAHYGPETIEEAEVMLIQWSRDWVTRAQHDATYTEMQKVGQFKDGYYVTVDSDGKERRADGRDAVWETFMQRKLVYPVPRYAQPVIMEPQGFAWRPVGDGADIKMMGRFTEDDVYVAQYRWEPGGSLGLTSERTQLVWVNSGQVEVNGQTYPARTAIFSDYDEKLLIRSDTGAEATCFGMPVPSDVLVGASG